MNRQQGKFGFGLMSLGYKFRDFRLPRMDILKEVIVDPPIHIGDRVVKDVLGKGIDVVATRSVKEKVIQNTR